MIDWEDVIGAAEDAYTETQCAAGCCGSLSTAFVIVRARVETEIQELEDRIRFQEQTIMAQQLAIASLEGVINDLRAREHDA